MTATSHGHANSYWNADDAAKRLTVEQRELIAGVVQRAKDLLAPSPGQQLRRLDRSLSIIGARVQPGIDEQAAAAWIGSLLDSLSSKPFDLIVRAVDAARHKQFRYLNEVGPWLEEHMADALADRRRVMNRLRQIEMAARSLPAATPVCEPEEAAQIIAETLGRLRA